MVHTTRNILVVDLNVCIRIPPGKGAENIWGKGLRRVALGKGEDSLMMMMPFICSYRNKKLPHLVNKIVCLRR